MAEQGPIDSFLARKRPSSKILPGMFRFRSRPIKHIEALFIFVIYIFRVALSMTALEPKFT